LEIMHEGTVGNHDAIGKIKGKEKEPCDCKWKVVRTWGSICVD
jgi:hypothetical protein